MQYTRLGRSGPKVSRICLPCESHPTLGHA